MQTLEGRIETYRARIGEGEDEIRVKVIVGKTIVCFQVVLLAATVILYIIGDDATAGFALTATVVEPSLSEARHHVAGLVNIQRTQLAKLKGALDDCKKCMTAKEAILIEMTGEHAREMAQNRLLWKLFGMVAQMAPVAIAERVGAMQAEMENRAVMDARVAVERLRDDPDHNPPRRDFEAMASAVEEGIAAAEDEDEDEDGD